MSDPINSTNPELLVELSEQEQETVAGGCALAGFSYFFFQQTDIDTFAENEAEVSDSNGFRGSSLARTGYRFSQTTLAFGSFLFDPKPQPRGFLSGLFGLFGF